MSNYYAMYDDESGQITRIVQTAPEGIDAWGEPYIPVPERIDDRLYYVSDGQLVERPELPAQIDRIEIAADGEDEAVLSGLPIPATVLIDGEPYEVDDGSLEFVASQPGRYRIEVKHWPYLDYSVEVIAS